MHGKKAKKWRHKTSKPSLKLLFSSSFCWVWVGVWQNYTKEQKEMEIYFWHLLSGHDQFSTSSFTFVYNAFAADLCSFGGRLKKTYDQCQSFPWLADPPRKDIIIFQYCSFSSSVSRQVSICIKFLESLKSMLKLLIKQGSKEALCCSCMGKQQDCISGSQFWKTEVIGSHFFIRNTTNLLSIHFLQFGDGKIVQFVNYYIH